MSDYEDFITEIKKTETMQALLQSLEKEPVKILSDICREYEATSHAIPDHHLNLAGYFGEAMLRILLSANLVVREPGDKFSLYSYKPTEEGLRHYRNMLGNEKAGD